MSVPKVSALCAAPPPSHFGAGLHSPQISRNLWPITVGDLVSAIVELFDDSWSDPVKERDPGDHANGHSTDRKDFPARHSQGSACDGERWEAGATWPPIQYGA